MSFSFLSDNRSSDRKNIKNTVIPSIVQTMQDDIKAIERGGKEPILAYGNEGEEQSSVRNTSSKPPVNPFGEEGEELSQIHTEETKPTENPFGVAPQPKKDIPGEFSQSRNMTSGVSPTILEGELLVDHFQRKRGLLVIIGIVATMLLLVLVGAYYYFFVSKQTAEPLAPQAAVQNSPETVTENIQKELPYALDKPNYLSINTETVSSLDIQKTLLQAAFLIRDASIAQPVEFLITDQNNNPIAFNRFAFLFNLDIAPDVFTLIDEPFSLYIYNDAGSMRLGLDLTLKDQATVLSTLPKIESTLPYAFRALILESDVTVLKNVEFRSGAYSPRSQTALNDGSAGQEVSLRYANIDSRQGWSMDYAITNNHWYIGTSKNTLRALLDTIGK